MYKIRKLYHKVKSPYIIIIILATRHKKEESEPFSSL